MATLVQWNRHFKSLANNKCNWLLMCLGRCCQSNKEMYRNFIDIFKYVWTSIKRTLLTNGHLYQINTFLKWIPLSTAHVFKQVTSVMRTLLLSMPPLLSGHFFKADIYQANITLKRTPLPSGHLSHAGTSLKRTPFFKLVPLLAVHHSQLETSLKRKPLLDGHLSEVAISFNWAF